MIDRVILWGFMASGKSTVGAQLAARLGWECVDIDREIERREGRTIAAIFASEGEPRFRALEVAVTREQIGRRGVVFACGGGWVTNRELLLEVPPGSATVWLRVSPETVVDRVRADVGGAVRPLLSSADPVEAARGLLERREPLYRQADIVVETDGRSAREIADEIEAHVRRLGVAPLESSMRKDHAYKG